MLKCLVKTLNIDLPPVCLYEPDWLCAWFVTSWCRFWVHYRLGGTSGLSVCVLRGHLLGKGWPLGSRLWCLLWVCHFPIGILGQVWYLIVSIPDLCNLTYFLCCVAALKSLPALSFNALIIQILRIVWTISFQPWPSFVVSDCEFITFPLVSWVRCGTRLYRFLIFAPLLTFTWTFSRTRHV